MDEIAEGGLLSQFQLFSPPARAAETLNLKGTLSDLVTRAFGLTPAEIDLLWQTALPRHAHPAARNVISREGDGRPPHGGINIVLRFIELSL